MALTPTHQTLTVRVCCLSNKGRRAYILYWCCTHVQEFDGTAYVQVHAANYSSHEVTA